MTKAKSKAPAGAKAEATEEAESVEYPYSVAEGRSITSKKGVLSEGQEVKSEYLAGGQDALDNLVTAKIVNKAK